MPVLDSPTLPHRPLGGALQGLTLLAVEDSRYAGEALRLSAQRLGARLRRAESLAAAERHLKLYRPDVVLIDIGLPDGSGLELIGQIRARRDAPPVIAMSGDGAVGASALAAGAAQFLEKPLPGLSVLQREILVLLPGRRGAPSPDLPIHPDRLALSEDLARAAELLETEAEGEDRRYLALFLAGVARHSRDLPLATAAEAYRAKESGATQTLARLLRHRLGERHQPFV